MNELFENIDETCQQQRKRFRVCYKFFKRLNDDLINVFV